MPSFISDLLRVIPLAVEERISNSIRLDAVLPAAPAYVKSSMWRKANLESEAEITRNRNHVQNYAFLFMLSLVSCLGFSAPICSLSSLFFTRLAHEGMDYKSSIYYGAIVSTADFSLAFSIILVYFYGWNRRFVVILVAVFVLSTAFYIGSMFFIDNKQYIGIMFLFGNCSNNNLSNYTHSYSSIYVFQEMFFFFLSFSL